MKKFNIKWSTVCTVASCIGTVVTGILASFGGSKIAEEWDPNRGRGDKIKHVLKCQWPAISCGLITIGLDVISHNIDAKTIAKLTAAVGAGAAKLNAYREEVASEFGPEKESDISQRVNKRLMAEGLAPDLNELVHSFYEPVTKRYFDAPTSLVLQAINSVNVRLFEENVFEGVVTMSDFFILCNHSELDDEETRACGWYNGYIEMGGMPCVKVDFDSKVDRFGKRYFIICWGQGCEPEEDLNLSMWEDKLEKGA